MPSLKLLLLALLLSVTFVNLGKVQAHESLTQINSHNEFFKQLSSLCGKTFLGKTIYPTDPEDPFVGVPLTIHFNFCDENQIKVPFKVGNDTSRTWVISKTTKGLLLQHDHRHADNSPDEITMYGGYASKAGNATSQYFEADEYTTKLIPAAATNVWQISFDESRTHLIYYLERNSAIRYKAIFSL